MIYIEKNQEIAMPNGFSNMLCSMRITWREVATWTWIYLMSAYTKFGDITSPVFDHLYYIPEGMGVLLQFVFGYDNAQKFLQLLSAQLIITKDIIDSEIAGNSQLTDEKVRQLYINADERAKFASSIDPFWSETEVRNLLYTYNRYTLLEITDLLTRKYNDLIGIFELLLRHADNMGDYFAEGIVEFINFGQYKPK